MKLDELPKHHAILFVSNQRKNISSKIFKELQDISPAHRFFDQTVLDIGTARTIISWANIPYNEEKIGLISFHTIGLEAQNALLKILEEPRVGVRFILVTSNTSSLIETVLSRVLLIKDKGTSEELQEAETFLLTSHSHRMKLPYVMDIISRIDEQDRKDRESIRTFILSLTTVLERTKANTKYIQEVLEIASYTTDPSASGKALLEYLSLLLPQTSA